MPDQVRGILSISDQKDLTKLAVQADHQILEFSRPSYSTVSAVNSHNSAAQQHGENPTVASISKLMEKMDAHTRDLEKLRTDTCTPTCTIKVTWPKPDTANKRQCLRPMLLPWQVRRQRNKVPCPMRETTRLKTMTCGSSHHGTNKRQQ